MKAKCPDCSGVPPRFVTVAHVAEDWVVDENGNFITVQECTETVHGPNPSNSWTCMYCGAEAEIEL